MILKLLIIIIMKTPISYYGGKQTMLQHILPLEPKHNLYTEAFCGGAAYYWAKQPSEIEVINDINGEVVNFYSVLQTNSTELESLIKSTLHSKKMHHHAGIIYQNPELFSTVQRAWALWVLSTQSFACIIDGTFGYDRTSNSCAKKIFNAKKRLLSGEYSERIEKTQIESRNAIDVIRTRDCVDAFHYVDPPYFNSDCGHYGGYSEQDFCNLLDLLSGIKGKFLLSSYPSDILAKYVKKNKWKQLQFKKAVAVSAKAVKTKIEVVTANYSIS